jgi:hypothetical protein
MDYGSLDLCQPRDLPHYNSAMVIPLADRRLLVIRVSGSNPPAVSMSAIGFINKYRLLHQG